MTPAILHTLCLRRSGDALPLPLHQMKAQYQEKHQFLFDLILLPPWSCFVSLHQIRLRTFPLHHADARLFCDCIVQSENSAHRLDTVRVHVVSTARGTANTDSSSRHPRVEIQGPYIKRHLDGQMQHHAAVAMNRSGEIRLSKHTVQYCMYSWARGTYGSGQAVGGASPTLSFLSILSLEAEEGDLAEHD
jgi:hypothetical protein